MKTIIKDGVKMPDFEFHKNCVEIPKSTVKKLCPEFYEMIEKKYPSIKRWVERLYLYVHNMNEPVKCKICGKPVRFVDFTSGYRTYCCSKCVMSDPEVKESIKQTNIKNCGYDNPFKSPKIIQQIKQTCLERYGVENYTQTDEYTEKTKQTNNEKFGADYYSQTNEWVEKIKIGFNEKYGVDYYLQTDEFKERTKETNMEKLGVPYAMMSSVVQEKSRNTCNKCFGEDNPMKVESIQKRAIQTNIENLGVPYPMMNEKIKEKSKNTCTEKYGVENISQVPEIKIKKEYTCLKRNGVPYGFLLYGENDQKTPNKLEQKVINFLNELNIKNEFGVWNLTTNINGSLTQIDIFLNELNIAIEINGIFYHSLSNESVTKTQHIEKFLSCKEKNIELIYLWEDWIINDWGHVKEFLVAKINHKDVDKFKPLWFPDLNEHQWPNDLGWKDVTNDKIFEHHCFHGKFECYDSGYVIID